MEDMRWLIVFVFGAIFVGGLLWLCRVVYRALKQIQAHATRNMELDDLALDEQTLKTLEKYRADSSRSLESAHDKQNDFTR